MHSLPPYFARHTRQTVCLPIIYCNFLIATWHLRHCPSASWTLSLSQVVDFATLFLNWPLPCSPFSLSSSNHCHRIPLPDSFSTGLSLSSILACRAITCPQLFAQLQTDCSQLLLTLILFLLDIDCCRCANRLGQGPLSLRVGQH